MQEKIKSGAVNLNATRAWLKESMHCLMRDHPTLIGDVAKGDSESIIMAYGSAFLDLIEDKSLDIPETLQFDTNRIKKMRAEYERLVSYSVVLVTVKQYINNSAVSPNRGQTKLERLLHIIRSCSCGKR